MDSGVSHTARSSSPVLQRADPTMRKKNRTDPASALSTFAYTPSRSSEIIATGNGSDLYVVNIHRGAIVRKVRAEGPAVERIQQPRLLIISSKPLQQAPSVQLLHLRRATQLVASTITGSLMLMDARTPELAVTESVLAHTGGISQVETEGNNIVTVGYTMR